MMPRVKENQWCILALSLQVLSIAMTLSNYCAESMFNTTATQERSFRDCLSMYGANYQIYQYLKSSTYFKPWLDWIQAWAMYLIIRLFSYSTESGEAVLWTMTQSRNFDGFKALRAHLHYHAIGSYWFIVSS